VTELVGGHRGTVAQRTADAGVAPVWVVPLSDVHAGQELQEAVLAAVRSGWWSAGPRVAEFERAFADLCRTRHAIAVANGTAALHLALLAVGCGPGDEVVIPSLNFVAGANAIGHIGASAVFCDICGDDDLTLDPRDVEAAISPATKAIVVMHYGGHPCRMDEILDIADRRGITVIEDAAHAPGATLAGRPCGAMGAIGCFSFFSNKNIPMGEGGMVVTDGDELERRMRLLRSHGMTTLSWERHKGHATTYDVLLQGFNFRMDDLRAAMGLAQLPRLRDANAARGRIVGSYRQALHGFRGIRMPFPPRIGTVPAHHLAVILLPPGTRRHEVRAVLAAAGIQSSVHYPPTHRVSWDPARGRRRPLPRTDAVSERLLTLPLYPHMDDAAVLAVIDAVTEAVR
jgi:dTDP-4-amino-4,6-dideoxygalactose transaminase